MVLKGPFDDKEVKVEYRSARPEDVPEMSDLFLRAVADLYSRNNIAAATPPRTAVLKAYDHILSIGVFHAAVARGRIVAVSGAVIRGRVWYLSSFWALPELQRRKIGMPLLRLTWEEGVKAGAEVFCTWSSVDHTAMASYMKLGMLPGYQVLLFEGKPGPLSRPSGYEAGPLEKSLAMELDQYVRGARREADHELWSGSPDFRGRQVRRNGSFVGYYYIGNGSIGPAAWNEPQAARPLLELAFIEASETSPAVRLAVPGINHSALRFAFEAGLRLTGFAHFLTTGAFGQMEQYLPSGPSLY
ncbi:MAG: GNAT family N-acetyltransferase [Thermodesulfobacteriota bacterium]|nr:MAG: GNAT family N-acetyltransferase [Thermodesulfobacteriota bacterium]